MTPSQDQARPQRIGEIADTAFRMLPGVLGPALPLLALTSVVGGYGVFIFSTVFEAEGRTPQIITDNLVPFVVSAGVMVFVHVFLGLQLQALTTGLSSQLWCYGHADKKAVKEWLPRSISLSLFGQWLILSVGMLFGFILLLIPGVLYWLNRVLAPTVLVLERPSVGDSMRRSKALMKAGPKIPWWSFETPKARVTGLLMLGYLFSSLPAAANQGATVFLSTSWGPAPTLFALILVIIGTSLNLILTMFSTLCFVGFYYDLRCRIEGLDLFRQLERIA